MICVGRNRRYCREVSPSASVKVEICIFRFGGYRRGSLYPQQHGSFNNYYIRERASWASSYLDVSVDVNNTPLSIVRHRRNNHRSRAYASASDDCARTLRVSIICESSTYLRVRRIMPMIAVDPRYTLAISCPSETSCEYLPRDFLPHASSCTRSPPIMSCEKPRIFCR